MKAIEFKEVNVRIAENQPEYEALPVRVDLLDSTAPTTMCIELDKDEINQVINTRRIWLTVLTFRQHFHPIKMSLLKPDDCTDPEELVYCEICEKKISVEKATLETCGCWLCRQCAEGPTKKEQKVITGIELIAQERREQIEKHGWSSEYDARHINNELAIAASCYCLPDGQREFRVRDQWSLDYEYWRPTPENRIKELAKAGALIAAEIDRLLKEEDSSDSGPLAPFHG